MALNEMISFQKYFHFLDENFNSFKLHFLTVFRRWYSYSELLAIRCDPSFLFQLREVLFPQGALFLRYSSSVQVLCSLQRVPYMLYSDNVLCHNEF